MSGRPAEHLALPAPCLGAAHSVGRMCPARRMPLPQEAGTAGLSGRVERRSAATHAPEPDSRAARVLHEAALIPARHIRPTALHPLGTALPPSHYTTTTQPVPAAYPASARPPPSHCQSRTQPVHDRHPAGTTPPPAGSRAATGRVCAAHPGRATLPPGHCAAPNSPLPCPLTPPNPPKTAH